MDTIEKSPWLSKPVRIAISGPSGYGKTTLAKKLSDLLDIPFITTSAQLLWESTGGHYPVHSHQDVIQMSVENPKVGIRFQHDLLELRAEMLKDSPSFVTDRSPIDNLTYFLLQNAPFGTQSEFNDYRAKCLQQTLDNYDFIFLLSARNYVMVNGDEARRVGVIEYQSTIARVMENIVGNLLPGTTRQRVKILGGDFVTLPSRITKVLEYLPR
jgi:hypothetical protein